MGEMEYGQQTWEGLVIDTKTLRDLQSLEWSTPSSRLGALGMRLTESR